MKEILQILIIFAAYHFKRMQSKMKKKNKNFGTLFPLNFIGPTIKLTVPDFKSITTHFEQL
jgi:hypothetical protein